MYETMLIPVSSKIYKILEFEFQISHDTSLLLLSYLSRKEWTYLYGIPMSCFFDVLSVLTVIKYWIFYNCTACHWHTHEYVTSSSWSTWQRYFLKYFLVVLKYLNNIENINTKALLYEYDIISRVELNDSCIEILGWISRYCNTRFTLLNKLHFKLFRNDNALQENNIWIFIAQMNRFCSVFNLLHKICIEPINWLDIQRIRYRCNGMHLHIRQSN